VLTVVNFVTPFLLLLQDVLYWGVMPGWEVWLYTGIMGPLIFAFGWFTFSRLQRNLAVEL
jgi:ABC-type polysaccharide/polyol phosphate export permease